MALIEIFHDNCENFNGWELYADGLVHYPDLPVSINGGFQSGSVGKSVSKNEGNSGYAYKPYIDGFKDEDFDLTITGEFSPMGNNSNGLSGGSRLIFQFCQRYKSQYSGIASLELSGIATNYNINMYYMSISHQSTIPEFYSTYVFRKRGNVIQLLGNDTVLASGTYSTFKNLDSIVITWTSIGPTSGAGSYTIPSERITDIKIEIFQRIIEGYVKDIHDDPISGAAVTDGTLTATTNADGFYQIIGSRTSYTYIKASKSGFYDNTISQSSDGTYDTVTCDFTLQTLPPALQSIGVTTLPTKLIYDLGDNLDIDGMVVTGIYSDGSTEIEAITVDNINGFDSSQISDNQILTITYEGKTTTFSIQITGVSIILDQVKQPVWTDYKLTWEDVENALSYIVRLYNEAGVVVSTQTVAPGVKLFDFGSILSAGTFTATVQASEVAIE